jgi:uncharacterized protein (TIGR03000 family)
VKKFLFLTALGVTAAALTLATPAVGFAGGHYGRGHYHSYHHRGYGYRGFHYWNRPGWYVTPGYYCPPAPPVCQDNLARIRLCVPAGARVWIDGQETTQTGTDRTFESPPLTPGKEFTYNVTAKWCCPDGKEVVRTRQVDVQANATVDLDLTRPVS